MYRDYYVDEKGIYYSEKGYHDDIDYYYVVEFNKENTNSQFSTFLQDVRNEGKLLRSQEIKRMLGL